ncbi:MAG: hypothetical protein HOY69_10685, partial [Streptomyces sp.]|nr:hypothetical protein [Streptomyces sp.]
MSRILTVVTADGAEHDVELTAPESAAMWDLAARFGQLWGQSPRDLEGLPGQFVYPRGDGVLVPRLFAGPEPLPAGMTLAESPLRDGMRVGLGRSVPPGPYDAGDRVTGPWESRPPEVRVVAGEGAGAAVLLPGRLESIVQAGLLAPGPDGAGEAGTAVLLRTRSDGIVELFPDGLAPGDVLRVEQENGCLRIAAVSGRGAVPGWRPPYRGFTWYPGTLLVVGRSCLWWSYSDAAEPDELLPGDHGTVLLDPRARPAARRVLDAPPAWFPSDGPARDRWWHSRPTRGTNAAA